MVVTGLEWGGPHEHATIAERGCIIRTVVGSTLHGLVRKGTDDRDEMGVCVEPPEYVLGLRHFEHWVHRSQPEGEPSGPGDLDLVVYGLRKYCRLALKGSPTVLLLLFAPPEALLVQTPLGQRLQALSPAFVSRRTGRAFLGYLAAQRRGLLGERHVPRRGREMSEEHDYDTKYAMHALRIGHQGVELLESGRITLPVPEPPRGALLEVRHGTVALEWIASELEKIQGRLEGLLETSALPPEPDYEAVDRFLVQAHEEAWSDPSPAPRRHQATPPSRT